MAQIVLGIGTSHGPMLVTETEAWDLRVPADKAAMHAWKGSRWSFDQLVEARTDEGFAAQITDTVKKERHARSQAAIEKLADRFEAAKVDVAIIFGNDQMEIFDDRLIPAFGVFTGETITNYEFPPERMAKLPPGIDVSVAGYIPQGGAEYAGAPALANHIVEGLIDDGFDVATMKSLPKPETPHAFGFVYRRIMRDAPCPTVPLLINTFYPPNTPRVARCEAFGKAVLRAVQSWDSNLRVALIASGGLTHFVIDESIDAMFLDAIRSRDMTAFKQLSESIFEDGTSEIKNWIPLVGAMATLGLDPDIIDYVPCYRSEAGTGNAMGFVTWQ
jgi:Catalytic LigB subunit of aromatic ring-opening dioxygenase